MTETPKRQDTPTHAPASIVKPITSQEERAQVEQHYETARKELRDLLQRKKQADKDLAALEAQIYRLEGNYLEDTQQGGNIVRGFDGYLKGMINSRKTQFAESDRLFSLSSVSYSETAQPDKDVKGQKKRRKTMDDVTALAGGSSDEEEGVQYSGNHKRARVTYAD